MSGKRMEVLVALVVAGATFAVAAPAGAQAASSHPAMAKKAPAQQATMKVKESTAGLAAQATVSADSAQKLALAQVPRGRVREAELEQSNGTLVYSYDIKAAGKSGVDEVLIDAKTGALVSKTHESPKAEAKEKAAESKSSQAAKPASAKSSTSAKSGTAKSTAAKSTSSKSYSAKSGTSASTSAKPMSGASSSSTPKDSTKKP
ncbi:MAG: PepSY domain-containing protein [Gemmatimonadaceae bacterium]